MGIAERVTIAVKDAERELQEKSEFRALRDFYAEMQRRGLAVKREYDIPPMDTIGRNAYRATTNK